jgi:hypothetical protein
VPASKWFVKAPMRMMFLSLNERERWELALKLLVGVAIPIH